LAHRYYGLVYLEEKKVKIYKLIDGKYVKILETKNETFIIKDLDCNIKIDFSKIW